MAEEYYPVSATNLQSVIRPGEEILYSTLAQFANIQRSSITKWKAHLLITDKVYAYTFPNANKAITFKVHPLEDISNIKKGSGGLWELRDLNLNVFTLAPDEKIESKENFKSRQENFVPKFLPNIIQRKKEWIDTNNNNPDVKKLRLNIMQKTLKKFEKMQAKLK